jgi:F0F1-type ATP synthase assembly protein I
MEKKKNNQLPNPITWKTNKQALKGIQLVIRFGSVMVSSIIIFVILGIIADNFFQTNGTLLIIGTIMGIVCGALVGWKLFSDRLDDLTKLFEDH